MKTELKVGQKVYLIASDSRNRKDVPEEATIKSIGNKYFFLEEYRFNRLKISIEDMHDVSEYSRQYNVYPSLQAIEDEKESIELIGKIRKEFSGYGRVKLSLEQLRAIDKIINPIKL